jgi:adenosylhomocysteine nucleosidase
LTDTAPSLFIFCALACEARPLIAAWYLKKLPQSGMAFTIYANAERVLVISGVGKIAMAGAVGYALALFPKQQSPILINFGIAGHRHEALGALCLGHKIIDSQSARVFYPQLPFTIPCVTHVVATHVKPHVDYDKAYLYDMEAAGFYEMAVKFSSSELIQVLKIVSDNAQSSIAHINEEVVGGWIDQQRGIIDSLLTQLTQLRQVMLASNPHQQLPEEFRFSVTDSIKLKRLLQRWYLLQGNEKLAWQEAKPRSGKEFINWLEKEIDRIDFYL